MQLSRCRVLIVSDSAAIDGGVAQVAIQSALGLNNAGVEVYFFAATGPVDHELGLALGERVTLIGQYDIRSDPNRIRAAMKGIANFTATAEFDRLVERISRANLVVHVHGWCKALSPLILRHIGRSKLPVVVTVHDYFLACPNGGFYDYRREEICFREPLSISCITCNCDSRRYADKLWRLARSSIQRYVMNIPDCLENFIVISALCRKIIGPFLPPGARVFEVDNPVGAVREERARAENSDIFLFVGRFSREKGVLIMAEAAQKAGAKVVFAGDGYLKAELERMIPSAVFTGWLSPQGVKEWMARARIVVFPSTWYETLGLVPIEAASLGIPCIISDCTATVEYLPDSIRAIHFKHSDVSDLLLAFGKAADDRLVEKLSRASYEWYWKNPWTVERHIARLQEIYKTIWSGAAAANSLSS